MSKIIATVSPDTENLDGIDIGRINGSFGTKEDITALVARIKKDMKAPVLLDLPRTRKKRRTNTYTDDELIELAKKIGVSYLGLSYVKNGGEVEEVRAKIRGTDIKLISKIEAEEAQYNLDGIIRASDGVMIDRGDLGRSVGVERLHNLQKKIIRKSNHYGTMVIVATEMMYSMIENAEPTKAEVLDIANAVADGADYVMLSEETAIGKHPNHVVRTMKKIIDAVSEKYKVIILAAGSGAGLGAITARHHVCLTDIGGKTILDLQLESLKRNGINEEDIIIATGKGEDEIRKYLKGTEVEMVFNPWHDTTNMMTTIWLARHLIQKGFIVIYGDIIFEDAILNRVIKNKSDIVLAVEKKMTDEEDEKVCVKDGKVSLHAGYGALFEPKHKCIPPKDAYGEFIGMAKFNRQGAILLSNEMDEIIIGKKFGTYLVTAFESLVGKGHPLYVEDVTGLVWNDNDTIADIQRSRAMLPQVLERNDLFKNR
jgi:choline kinase